MAGNMTVRRRNTDAGCLDIFAYSIIGSRREQQDYAVVAQDVSRALAAVCDGMGGMEGGGTASREAATLLLNDYTAACSDEGEGFSPPVFLKEEAVEMDELVSGLHAADGTPLRSGSTVAAVLVEQDQMDWLSVGDSRIYLLRGGRISRLTRDHNYRLELDEMLAKGKISREVYEQECRSKKAEALSSYLGMGGLRRIDVGEHPLALEDGDVVLVCSDGLYKTLRDQQIEAVLAAAGADIRSAAQGLLGMAMEQNARKQDNATVVLIRYQKPKGGKADGTLLSVYENICRRVRRVSSLRIHA